MQPETDQCGAVPNWYVDIGTDQQRELQTLTVKHARRPKVRTLAIAPLRTILAFLFALATTSTAVAEFDDGVKALAQKNYAMALQEFRTLANNGHPGGQYYLGRLYLMGEGVSADYKQAAALFRKAAAQGHAIAQFYLGALNYLGEGVPKDYAKAVKWYRRAAEQGNHVAQHHLGVMQLAGEGVPQDYVQALMWFNLAAARGSKPAGKFRKLIITKMTPTDISKAKRLAREWKVAPGKSKSK